MLLGSTICYVMCSFGGIGFENEFLFIEKMKWGLGYALIIIFLIVWLVHMGLLPFSTVSSKMLSLLFILTFCFDILYLALY